MKTTKEEIIKYLNIDSSRPLYRRELYNAFKVTTNDKGAFKALLDKLVFEGDIVEVKRGRYGVTKKLNLIKGTLECHPSGYGFVLPNGIRGDDLFIKPSKFKGAMHGDTVLARLDGTNRDGKREGSINKIVERANTTIVGHIEIKEDVILVIPANERILNPIIVQKQHTMGAKDGEMVAAEITTFPVDRESPMGRITEVLGDPDSPEVEAAVILKKFNLSNTFPESVLEEAQSIPSKVSEAEIKDRKDLRDLPFVTIDGETARDFDDAIFAEKTEKGYKIFVSIADVSHYVKEKSPIDKEAFSRATSVYFPDRCIPMLPEKLSNGICSLNPHVDRLSFTAEINLNSKGEIKSKTFYESVIRSSERLTYTNVAKVIKGNNKALLKKYHHIKENLYLMEEISLKLNKHRTNLGSIDFDLPEPVIEIDNDGVITNISRSERNTAHRLIEEFMLCANMAVAEKFTANTDRGIFPYRIHETPDREKLEHLKEFAATMGYEFKTSGGPRALKNLLKQVHGKPEEHVLNHIALRTLKQAKYDTANVGHFGLAFSDYTHFTSPIRRYPDLMVHRLLKKLISTSFKQPENEQQFLVHGCEHSSIMERRAMEAERESIDLKKCQFMSDKIGEEYMGLVSSVTSFGIFVELEEYFVEGLVHVSTLDDDYYIYDDKRHTMRGESTKKTYTLGTSVKIRIRGVDLERRQIDMAVVVDETERELAQKKKKKKKFYRRKRN